MSHVEAMTAMVLLADGLLSLAAGSGWMIRSGLAAQESFGRMVALQATVEEMNAVPIDELESGSALQGDFEVLWTLKDHDPNSALIEFVAIGPLRSSRGGGGAVGSTRGVADTLQYRSARR